MRIKLLIALVIMACAGSLVWFYGLNGKKEENRYRTAAVERGDIVKTVSANGTLNPVVLAMVGTQVSGVIIKLKADFNQKVEKGQVLAELDPSLIKAQLQQSLANLENFKAALKLAEHNEGRTRALIERHYASQFDLDQAVQNVAAARAQVAVGEALVNRDRTNLGYTVITSPVSGVVVSRNIDVGQTVAASFQTPTLFTIAQDLKQMQIYTTVAEADVGGIRVGQPVHFTVDAFPDRVFNGSVKQIRLDAKSLQNVVTYNVVIDVENPDGILLPSMTAFVGIVVDDRRNALKLPVAALRFKPEETGKPEGKRGGAGKPAGKTVYRLVNGKPVAMPVQTGISDGKSIEVIGETLKEGEEIILEETATGKGAKSQQPAGNFKLKAF
ncbi:MAG: efflux RND transporter periplasmic adaptor subunit [Proteobacteria bacterium]|nr:efflux RND transporter periplasmic adaptor subunit [Pseudomonadota bacterium]